MKIAIVTGASSGMGREFIMQIADRFSGIGEIWAIARREERLEELSPLVPVKVRSFAIDLTDDSKLMSLQDILAKEKPEVKWLINSAGYGKIGDVGTINIGDEMGMVDLNCKALCAVTHMVLPYMSENSRIIQFSSAASFLPQPGFAIYAATKSFVLSYSRALNEELKKRGIYVTAVCPGPVKTEFFDIAETTGKIPLYKRVVMADPKKVVRLALRDSMMGRPVSVYGITMKFFRLLCKTVPHTAIFRLMKGLMKAI
ncbi:MULTISPECIES: SDR family oxidoreductase [Clostridia]|uniref:SDR family NAD(P)-dependent oxidoreductase n=1 Tax=Clostridia TaxID=186801 RepID=UPI0012B3CB85|nr:SDR family NAD(P)-dependent oxidoreductase [Clostridium sp. WB02_MRS01]MBW4844288.1 SDR family NAD(P)-dependent oxidoreductase [Lachnospiraceae bacterium]MSS07271.1 SDR family NAD(P)-dependent oxidoreductase [Clostridium sp. WB02_MRS01]